MDKQYALKDISIIIPTYNRSEDLAKTLKTIVPFIKSLNEIIIVDQSKNDLTKKLIKNINNKKIRYIFSNMPSITIARNKGIKNLSSKGKIVVFIDDDVNIGNNYFSEILRVFNENSQAKAVGAYRRERDFGFVENLIRKTFLLEYFENKERARIISAYGNTYPKKLEKVINSQWLPGVNMAYKKEIFNEQQFDEKLLGYTIAEDIDFSYRLYKKYPNSIFLTPFPKIVHRASNIERTPTEKISYINQIDHFYFNFKNLNKNILQKIQFIWTVFGITLLRTLNLLIKPNKINYLKLKYFFNSLFYCMGNISKIKKGILRDFESKLVF